MAHNMTPARKAALRKAQLASAKKRKRRAVVRNTGRGIVGSKRGSRKMRYRVIRAGAGLAAAGAVAYGAHKTRQHLAHNTYTLHAEKKDYKFKGGKRVLHTSRTIGKSSGHRITVRGRKGRHYSVQVNRHRH